MPQSISWFEPISLRFLLPSCPILVDTGQCFENTFVANAELCRSRESLYLYVWPLCKSMGRQRHPILWLWFKQSKFLFGKQMTHLGNNSNSFGAPAGKLSLFISDSTKNKGYHKVYTKQILQLVRLYRFFISIEIYRFNKLSRFISDSAKNESQPK